MQRVIIEGIDDICVLKLHNGVINAIDLVLLDDFDKALQVIKEKFKALIITGGDKFFSIGFDLPKIVMFDRKELDIFIHKFNEVILNLYTINIPTAALLNGHAIAGGCILAIACDYIFSTESKKYIGLNEIKLGLPVPYLADMILRQIVNDKIANNLLYTGEFITAEEAKEYGIISETYKEEEIEQKVIERLKNIAKYSNEVFAEMKSNRTETVLLRYKKHYREKKDFFVNSWFKEETQNLLKEALKKF